MLTKKYKNGFITLDAGMFPSVAEKAEIWEDSKEVIL